MLSVEILGEARPIVAYAAAGFGELDVRTGAACSSEAGAVRSAAHDGAYVCGGQATEGRADPACAGIAALTEGGAGDGG